MIDQQTNGNVGIPLPHLGDERQRIVNAETGRQHVMGGLLDDRPIGNRVTEGNAQLQRRRAAGQHGLDAGQAARPVREAENGEGNEGFSSSLAKRGKPRGIPIHGW